MMDNKPRVGVAWPSLSSPYRLDQVSILNVLPALQHTRSLAETFLSSGPLSPATNPLQLDLINTAPEYEPTT